MNDKNPLSINTLTPSIMARKVGKRLIIIPTESLEPSKKVSYTGTFFLTPYIIINKTIKGIIKLEIYLMMIPLCKYFIHKYSSNR